MERRYIFFETGPGCLVGLAGSVLAAAAGLVAHVRLRLSPWTLLATVAAVATPIVCLAFRIERRGGPKDEEG